MATIDSDERTTVDASVTSGDLGPGWVVVNSHFAEQLKTTHRATFHADARKVPFGEEQITQDVPGGDVSQLDERGLVQTGTEVEAGDILIGKITPLSVEQLSPEEKLLRAIFGEKAGDVRDSSVRVPAQCWGTVVEAKLEDSPEKDVLRRGTVVLSWDSPLAVGDVLLVGEQEVTVAAIRELSADIALAEGFGTVSVTKVGLASDVIAARSIGPYSLVTQQPLGGRELYGGQKLSRKLVQALADNDAHWTVTELMTIKSDSVPGRIRAYEDQVRRQDPNPFASAQESEEFTLADAVGEAATRGNAADAVTCVMPTAVDVLDRELQAMCLEVAFDRRQVSARLLTSDELRERSHGVVEKPETINYRTFKPERDGLFCQKIFGPVRDYECACGKYKRMEHRGVVCEKCGVEVIPSKTRRFRFGHIDLAAPIAHPFFRGHIACLLDVERDVVDAVLGYQRVLASTDEPTEPIGELGASELREALAQLNLREMALGAGSRGELAQALLDRGLEAPDFIYDTLLVLPPDLRPLVPLDGGRFATSDLNDLYRRVINRNSRLKRLIELDAPAIILRNEARELQESTDALFANEKNKRKITGPNGRHLRSLSWMAESRLSESLVEKRVDYSGVASLVVDPSLDAGACRLPMEMARELFKPMAYGRMETDGHVTTIRSAKQALKEGKDFALGAVRTVAEGYPLLLVRDDRIVAREIALWEHPAIAVDAWTAELLGRGEIRVYLPLSEKARAECDVLDDLPEVNGSALDGWFSQLLDQSKDGVFAIGKAAIYGEADPLVNPVVRAALGHEPSASSAST